MKQPNQISIIGTSEFKSASSGEIYYDEDTDEEQIAKNNS